MADTARLALLICIGLAYLLLVVPDRWDAR